jgi:diaminohydroxyphosphoribosylaminopyrimidine deaminase/5-amino-6-(5-phosphoribosylamino)uracil reductase
VTTETLRETYMNRCLDLARLGLGNTAPNPLVGSVIVHDGYIIGEGFHYQFGGSHAEVNAVNSVKDKSLLRNSVLYVNLEPCSHTGKTPPCADMIINTGIPEVVIGTADPNPLVSGNGIKKLQNSGIRVVAGILQDPCHTLNRRFITFHTRRRPYIILKWAQTSDGFIDVLRENPGISQPTWISNEISRILVHKWRSEEQAILVGTQTATMDNPQLNVREWPGNSPVRMVIDRKLALSKKLNLFDNTHTTIVFNEVINLQEGQTHYVRLDFDGNMIASLLSYLYEKEIQSVLVEGGRMLIDSFIQANLWDEARVFIGNKQFGAGVSAPEILTVKPEEIRIREDVLMLYRNYHENTPPQLIN